MCMYTLEYMCTMAVFLDTAMTRCDGWMESVTDAPELKLLAVNNRSDLVRLRVLTVNIDYR
jgi:hypothetical protein